MYTQARVFIRTALIYLLAAFLLGGLILVNQGLNLNSRIWALLPVFYHLLTVGWITQLICGVALWMFPVYTKEQPRGDERLGWIAYATLNVGLVLRVIFEPVWAWSGNMGWMLAVSAVLQLLAIVLFVVAIWPRVKTRPGKKA